jgi:hypothetical protein
VLEGECAPETSVPFWEKLGFKANRNRRGPGGGIYAHKILERRFPLSDGARLPFEVGFYPPARDYIPDTQPFRTYAGEALLRENGSLQLPERAVCFTAEEPHLNDCVVRIVANAILLFEDKVKRPEAKSFGISQDAGYIYHLDRIFRPNAG